MKQGLNECRKLFFLFCLLLRIRLLNSSQTFFTCTLYFTLTSSEMIFTKNYIILKLDYYLYNIIHIYGKTWQTNGRINKNTGQTSIMVTFSLAVKGDLQGCKKGRKREHSKLLVLENCNSISVRRE